MQCPKCGAALPLDAACCPKCGTKHTVRRARKPGKRCPGCGSALVADAPIKPKPRPMKSPLTGLFVALIVVLSVIVVGAAGYLIWYFFF